MDKSWISYIPLACSLVALFFSYTSTDMTRYKNEFDVLKQTCEAKTNFLQVQLDEYKTSEAFLKKSLEDVRNLNHSLMKGYIR